MGRLRPWRERRLMFKTTCISSEDWLDGPFRGWDVAAFADEHGADLR